LIPCLPHCGKHLLEHRQHQAKVDHDLKDVTSFFTMYVQNLDNVTDEAEKDADVSAVRIQ